MIIKKTELFKEKATVLKNKLEGVLNFELPTSYWKFIIEFDALACYCKVDPPPLSQELSMYFMDEMIIEELFNLDKLNSLYFEELFFNLDVVKESEILFIGTFLGGRDLIGLGLGSSNKDQIYFVDANLFPEVVDEIYINSNFAINMGIFFSDFIERFKNGEDE